jgi:glycosyltransferase 2 family protein
VRTQAFQPPVRRLGASWLLGFVVSGISLAAVVWWISKQESPQLPDSGGGYAWLAAALAVIAANFGLRGWRWHLILRRAAVPHRRRDAYGLTLVGYMGNNVLPARGGELLKIGLLGQRTTARRREVLGTVLVERVLDAAVAVVLLAALTWAGVDGAPGGRGGAALAVLGLGAVAGAVALYLWLRRRGRFERFAATIRPVAGALKLLARPQGAGLFVLSLAIWTIDGLSFLMIARAIGVELDPLVATGVVVLASLAAAIPAAPGYVGTFDAGMLLGLHAADVAGGDAVGVLLLARFMYFVPVTLVGLATLLVGYRGGAQARRSVSTTWKRSSSRMSTSSSANVSDQRSRT